LWQWHAPPAGWGYNSWLGFGRESRLGVKDGRRRFLVYIVGGRGTEGVGKRLRGEGRREEGGEGRGREDEKEGGGGEREDEKE